MAYFFIPKTHTHLREQVHIFHEHSPNEQVILLPLPLKMTQPNLERANFLDQEAFSFFQHPPSKPSLFIYLQFGHAQKKKWQMKPQIMARKPDTAQRERMNEKKKENERKREPKPFAGCLLVHGDSTCCSRAPLSPAAEVKLC